MNKCPYCGAQPCLPSWQRLSVGASGAAHCQNCGRGVRVDSRRAWVAIFPIFLLSIAVIGGWLRDPLTGLLVLLLGYSFVIVLYYAWLPLKPDPFASPETVEKVRARIAAEKAAKEEN